LVKREAVELGLWWGVDMVFFRCLVVDALDVDGLMSMMVLDVRFCLVSAGHGGLYVVQLVVYAA
jgi:hypothetical protein